MKNPLKVVYILGSGHSGSTLLDLILGSHSRIESVGELKKYRDYFSHSSELPEKKRRCTCGVKAMDCDFWSEVHSRLSHELNQQLQVHGLNDATDPGGFEARHVALIRAILAVAGKDVLCDSSKDLEYLHRYLSSPRFDVCIIHLVRDGRAVANSYKRKGRNYFYSLRKWQAENLEQYKYRQTRCSDTKHMTINYERLAEDPIDTTKEIMRFLGLEYEKKQMCFWKIRHHNIHGNHMRRAETQVVERDKKYLSKLNILEWVWGSIVALPALLLFKYDLRRK